MRQIFCLLLGKNDFEFIPVLWHLVHYSLRGTRTMSHRIDEEPARTKLSVGFHEKNLFIAGLGSRTQTQGRVTNQYTGGNHEFYH